MKEQDELNHIGSELAEWILNVAQWRTNKRIRLRADRYLKKAVEVAIVKVAAKAKEIDMMIPDAPSRPLFT